MSECVTRWNRGGVGGLTVDSVDLYQSCVCWGGEVATIIQVHNAALTRKVAGFRAGNLQAWGRNILPLRLEHRRQSLFSTYACGMLKMGVYKT